MTGKSSPSAGARASTSDARSRNMRNIRSADTRPELRLRKYLWAQGMRYRLNRRIERCRPDLVFPGPAVAVFVDGCFWHGCPQHYIMPRTRHPFWQDKLKTNVDRDAEQSLRLTRSGWRVVRIWEHEVMDDLEAAASIVASALNESEKSSHPAQHREVVWKVSPTEDALVEERHLRCQCGGDHMNRVVLSARNPSHNAPTSHRTDS